MSPWNHANRLSSLLRQLTRLVFFGTLIGFYIIVDVSAFNTSSKPSTLKTGNSFLKIGHLTGKKLNIGTGNKNRIRNTNSDASSTSLNVLLEVPEYFFTFTFPMLGILLSVSKGFARLRLEESAWEQRLEEARAKRLREDPTLTELELRRKEASMEWSAYGKPRKQEVEREKTMREGDEEGSFGRGRRGVKVREREDRYDDSYDDNRDYHMNDDEINKFEFEYGIEYDPYYDDPYSEDELPNDIKFRVDKKYGDRIYENGEIFYKDKASGLFYRQGAKPRNLSFFG